MVLWKGTALAVPLAAAKNAGFSPEGQCVLPQNYL